jgi:hypothetical protein
MIWRLALVRWSLAWNNSDIPSGTATKKGSRNHPRPVPRCATLVDIHKTSQTEAGILRAASTAKTDEKALAERGNQVVSLVPKSPCSIPNRKCTCQDHIRNTVSDAWRHYEVGKYKVQLLVAKTWRESLYLRNIKSQCIFQCLLFHPSSGSFAAIKNTLPREREYRKVHYFTGVG